MKLQDQTLFAELFYSACAALMRQKGPDYAPDGIPLLDLQLAAAEANVAIPQALWPLYRKHFSAIRKHFLMGQPLTSESVDSRLQDATNFFMLLAFYEANRHRLHMAWRKHWEKQRCACVYEDPFDRSVLKTDLCEKCLSLRWLERQAFNLGSDRTSSRSTRRERG